MTSFAIEAGGHTVEVRLRRNARAHRYVLRLAPRGNGAVVTLPVRGTVAEAQAFVARHADWLAERIGRLPRPDDASPPAEIPLRGRLHRVVASGALRGLVRVGESADGTAEIVVAGLASGVRRRLLAHLGKLARADITAAVTAHAAALGVTVSAIRLRDTTSRWGSATGRGNLSFSWRLIMAPPFVLDYVAAHEVAHLLEMNHSPRFWDICRRLSPRSDEARLWLRQHGTALHRVI